MVSILDSRRLTGPSLLLDGPGCAIEVAVSQADADRLLVAWHESAQALLAALDWPIGEISWRRYPGGATAAFEAPETALYSACEVNEAAWRMANEEPERRTPATYVEALRTKIDAEWSPPRVELRTAALARGLRFLADDEWLTIGSGSGSISWPVDNLPAVPEVPWDRLSDIPVALITGTNGKTTTVRLLSAMASAAGRFAGNTSTDGVQMDGEFILRGDYTGGEGARTILRDQRVDMALLEVARGGMLRRGLPVEEADAALVSNVGNDHLGEYGIDDLDALAQVKLLVSKASRSGGELIVNIDDPRLQRLVPEPDQAVTLGEHAGPGFTERSGRLGALLDSKFIPWVETRDVPITVGGAARHNIYNCLGAMAVANAIGLGRRAIVEGLTAFRGDAASNPGRCNLFEYGDLRVIADFAHNPEGIDAALQMARAMRPARLLLVLGQAGDRDDASIDELARVVWRHAPDRVLLKEMERYLRGRQSGEVTSRLAAELALAGAPAGCIEQLPSEAAAVQRALEWADAGDILLVLLHADRSRMLEYFESLQTGGWLAGDTLPPLP